MRVLPILFNTEMVNAILNGTKSVTRRLIRHDTRAILNSPFRQNNPDVPDKQIIEKLCLPPCEIDDVLYVRETWTELETVNGCPFYAYRADDEKAGISLHETFKRWYPSIHMPKDAARIFLKVTDVRAERLWDITAQEVVKEGVQPYIHMDGSIDEQGTRTAFMGLWNSTIKKADLDLYGWDANPWVWRIEFERCDNPEEKKQRGKKCQYCGKKIKNLE